MSSLELSCTQLANGRWSDCITCLAEGSINPLDLCPPCTQAFMAALDDVSGPLPWHEVYVKRAEGN
jgi:hypothetical protein